MRSLSERVAEDAPHALLCSDAGKLANEASFIVDDGLPCDRDTVLLELLANLVVKRLKAFNFSFSDLFDVLRNVHSFRVNE